VELADAPVGDERLLAAAVALRRLRRREEGLRVAVARVEEAVLEPLGLAGEVPRLFVALVRLPVLAPARGVAGHEALLGLDLELRPVDPRGETGLVRAALERALVERDGIREGARPRGGVPLVDPRGDE
jgi:hypothetical protein